MDFIIREPIWNGGRRCVGLADHKLEDHNTFEVTYLDKYGNRVYPKVYGITKEEARKFPLRPAKGRVPALRIVPIPVDLTPREIKKINETKVKEMRQKLF